MKKIIFGGIMVALILGGCSVEDTESITEEDVEVVQEETTEEVQEEVAVEETILVDNEQVKITFTDIEYDEIFSTYEVNVNIENKSTDTIEVQTREFSVDGVMVDDNVFFSETVSGEKQSKTSIDIMEFEGEEITIEENLEFDFVILNEETYEEISRESITIELK